MGDILSRGAGGYLFLYASYFDDFNDGFSAKLINYPNLYSISATSARLSQLVIGVSNHNDKGELSVLIRFTNLDNRIGILN
jgi:hypothetical protein